MRAVASDDWQWTSDELRRFRLNTQPLLLFGCRRSPESYISKLTRSCVSARLTGSAMSHRSYLAGSYAITVPNLIPGALSAPSANDGTERKESSPRIRVSRLGKLSRFLAVPSLPLYLRPTFVRTYARRHGGHRHSGFLKVGWDPIIILVCRPRVLRPPAKGAASRFGGGNARRLGMLRNRCLRNVETRRLQIRPAQDPSLAGTVPVRAARATGSHVPNRNGLRDKGRVVASYS